MIRVAIVENDADERIKIRDCLTYLEQTDKTTFCITEFSSGTAFIGAYEPDYDIVFMDIEMPVMNGIEATKQIKNDSRYNKIPVIALTAHDIDEFQGQFTEACFDSIVEKPFTIDSISHVLAKFNFQ